MAGVEMIERRTFLWVPCPTHFGGFREQVSMVDWIRITLQRERVILEEAGIYKSGVSFLVFI